MVEVVMHVTDRPN